MEETQTLKNNEIFKENCSRTDALKSELSDLKGLVEKDYA